MRTVFFSPEARQDLLDIWNRIAADNIDVADRVRDKIQAAVTLLAERPGIGHARRDVKDPRYRFWKVYSYILAYRYDEQMLMVVRVVHGARNLRGLFRRPNQT